MKLKLFFSMMAVAAMTFTGCNKQTELEINYGRTARLQGQVTIFEETGASKQIASGIKVYAEVPYDMLVTTDITDGTGSNSNTENELAGYKTFETTTNDKGIYSFDIPVTYNSTQPFNVYTERKEMNEKFYYGETTVENFSSSVNATTIQNINMYATEATDAVLVVKGKVEISATPNNLPAAGFKVEVIADSRTYTTTTNTQGEYEISVPNVSNLSISVNVPAQTVNGKNYEVSNPSYPNNPGTNGKVPTIKVKEKTTI